MLHDARRKALVELCRELVCLNSVTGNEKDVAALLCRRMPELGFDEAWVDELGSVVGKIRGTGGGRSVLLDGHIDTVDVADPAQWTHPPFAAEVDGGRIYGRGTADMKGAVAAMVLAAGALAQDKRPAGDVYVSGTVLEEIAEGASLRHILSQNRVDTVIIGEASELNLNIGQRGRAEVLLETRGKSAHSSNPEKGVNAVLHMMALVQRLQKLPTPHSAALGDGILALTDILSSPYPGASVIPSTCSVTLDRRLLEGEGEAAVLGGIQAVIDQLKAEDPRFDAGVSIAGATLQYYTGKTAQHKKFAPAWLLDKDAHAALVGSAVAALRATGLSPAVRAYKFCTNGSASAGECGIPTLGFGPCAEWQAHVADEYIEIDQLCAAAEGYYALIGALAGA